MSDKSVDGTAYKKTKIRKKIISGIPAVITAFILIYLFLLEFAFVPYPEFMIKYFYRKYESDFIYVSEHLDNNDTVLYKADNIMSVNASAGDSTELRESVERIIKYARVYKICRTSCYNSKGKLCDGFIFLSRSSLNEKYTRGIVVISVNTDEFYYDPDMILSAEKINGCAYYAEYTGQSDIPFYITTPEHT